MQVGWTGGTSKMERNDRDSDMKVSGTRDIRRAVLEIVERI